MNRVVTTTPIGKLAIIHESEFVIEVQQVAPQTRATSNKGYFAREIERQFQGYFDGTLQKFGLSFLFENGTDFQVRVWQQINRIPYGTTQTYGEIAGEIKSGPRAVGNACRCNKLLLIIPCHRVVGAVGLGGFMGDADGSLVRRKQWLLEHEQKHHHVA